MDQQVHPLQHGHIEPTLGKTLGQSLGAQHRLASLSGNGRNAAQVGNHPVMGCTDRTRWRPSRVTHVGTTGLPQTQR
jgi:hypothetical protein